MACGVAATIFLTCIAGGNEPPVGCCAEFRYQWGTSRLVGLQFVKRSC